MVFSKPPGFAAVKQTFSGTCQINMCLFLESSGFIIPWKYNSKNKQTCTLTASTKYIPNDRPKLRCTSMAHL